MNTKISIPNNSLVFAPMEGAVTPCYRNIILKYYPDWDFVFTDFLRLPTGSDLKKEQIIQHIGKSTWEKNKYLSKTVLQIMPTERTSNQSAALLIQDLQLPWIDLNFGCPSKHVNRHHGGAALLNYPSIIQKIVKTIRNNYHGLLSAKIRLGVSDNKPFNEIIKILEGEGTDLIIIHPRTRDEMYKGTSRWEFIKEASTQLKIPVIGNGDITTPKHIDIMLKETNCHSVMIGRAALKYPWMAQIYRHPKSINQYNEIINFYHLLIEEMKYQNLPEKNIIITIKNLSHYLLGDFIDIREKLVRYNNLSLMRELLKSEK